MLLQLAHPLVAAGVAEHSVYAGDLWKRLLGTLRALYLITFGTRAEADRAGEIVHAGSRAREGSDSQSSRPLPGRDALLGRCAPELMLWVHSTLVYASLSAYQRFERKLSLPEQESYYRGRIRRTPESSAPPAR